MPRPGFELRRMEDEERRRRQAHRKLLWQRRLRRWPLAVGILILLGLLLVVLRLIGFAAG